MLKTYLSFILCIAGTLAQCERILSFDFEQLAHTETQTMDAVFQYKFTLTDVIQSITPGIDFYSKETKTYTDTKKVDLPRLRRYFDATELGMKYDLVYCDEAKQDKIDKIFYQNKKIVPYGAFDYAWWGRFDTTHLGTLRFEEGKTYCRPATADVKLKRLFFEITEEPKHPKYPTVVRLNFEWIADPVKRPETFDTCNFEEDERRKREFEEMKAIAERELEQEKLARKVKI